MSKLSFRARQLDANKPLPVYQHQELPDLSDISTINRAVPQMPTGMEKEEESEHHLQRALSTQQVIPTPETITCEGEMVQKLFRTDFKAPKQYIHVQVFDLDDEQPEYDMDTVDEEWLRKFNKKKELLTPLGFETIIDKLERCKGCTPQTLSYNEAKQLCKEGDEILRPVYDHWIDKYNAIGDENMNVMPQIKTERRDGTSAADPYVAFRRRMEKMQTRKNRKNDEASYEKMLKLRRDLNRACTILDMVKRREQSKKELIQLTIDVVNKRYDCNDFSGQLLAECIELLRNQQPTPNIPMGPPTTMGPGKETSALETDYREAVWREHVDSRPNDIIRHERKKHSLAWPKRADMHNQAQEEAVDGIQVVPQQSEALSEPEDDDDDPDGRFAFKRRKCVSYLAPRYDGVGNWPWTSPFEGGSGQARYRYSCLSISSPRRCVGFGRRRIGRGGRIWIDRAHTPYSENLDELDTLVNSTPEPVAPLNGLFSSEPKSLQWRRFFRHHYRPRSPSQHLYSKSSDALNHSESKPGEEIQAKPRVYRTFSSQPTSKFTLNPCSANGVVLPQSTHLGLEHRSSSNSTINSSAVNSLQNASSLWTNSNLTPSKNNVHSNVYSTAPVKSVLALNFPVKSLSSNSLLSNNHIKTSLSNNNQQASSPTSSQSPAKSTMSLSLRKNVDVAALNNRQVLDDKSSINNTISKANAASIKQDVT